jgi:hypothetical protein
MKRGNSASKFSSRSESLACEASERLENKQEEIMRKTEDGEW